MKSNYLLRNRDYTIYNALTWGNCSGHYRKARSATDLSQRMFHGAAALVELTPVVSQIVSLSEMALVSWFKSSIYGGKPMRDIALQEPALPHQHRWIAPPELPANNIEMTLPDQSEDLPEALFPLHRRIESEYKALPWPSKMKEITVFTQVQGGKGDVAAAAKAIALMQNMCPTLHFDWFLHNTKLEKKDLEPFLNCKDRSQVTIRLTREGSCQEKKGDFLLTGPVKLSWGAEYVENLIQGEINGPTFGFMENGQTICTFQPESLEVRAARNTEPSNHSLYPTLHAIAFPSQSGYHAGLLPMGLQPGSGVFLDPSRLKAPLSRGYCCPSYLPQIEDADLRMDILEAMQIFDGKSEPDFNHYSFNFGYAHHSASWGKFIDCVAIHEKNKQVIVVLNQEGAGDQLSTQEFQDRIFTPERLNFLKDKGYGTVQLKGSNSDPVVLQQSEEVSSRDLTVIIRPAFTPFDIKQMQLAAERLLATGDNSAVESWCARCKLYVYEDVKNMGCKWRFLQQQVDVAQTISPSLSQLLALFGGDRRSYHDSLTNKPLDETNRRKMEELLNRPDLSDATLQFCDRITSDYSFDDVLEGALKRAAWHHLIPQLMEVEANTIDEEFRSGFISYLKDPAKRVFSIQAIPEIGKRVQETVQRYLDRDSLK